MRPEWTELLETAKNSIPVLGMVARSTDDKSMSKIKLLIERSFVGIFISAVWIVASYQISSYEREAQNKTISAQSVIIEKSYADIKQMMREQTSKMEYFDVKFSEKHTLLSSRVSGLEVRAGVQEAIYGMSNKRK